MAILAAILCFAVSCTISEDNGQPVDPGTLPPGITDPGGNEPVVTVIETDFSSASIGIGDTLSIEIRVLSGTAASLAGVVAGQRVRITRSGDTTWYQDIRTRTGGFATYEFFSQDTGTVNLTFTYTNNATADVAVRVTANPTRQMTINAAPSVLPADGSSRSVVTVQVKNQTNNPIIGDTVRFSSWGGLITAESVTNSDGRATATLTSDRRNMIDTVTATLKSNGNTVQIVVEFSGVTISAAATPASLNPNDRDSSIILATLRDAANNPIVGERVTFSKSLGGTVLASIDSTTNSRGEARVVVKGSESGTEIITVTAAGAETHTAIIFTDQNITITPDNAHNRYVADAGQTSIFHIHYTQGTGAGINTSLREEDFLEVAVTLGFFNGEPHENNIIFSQILDTDQEGRVTITINNPLFSSQGTVFVRGRSNGVFASSTYEVYFRATNVTNIELKGTPFVIGINGGRTEIIATAYDINGNRARGIEIAFNMLNGPGGGEFLDPPTATTGSDGTARTYFVAGSIPSPFQKNVLIWASHYGYIFSSDTVRVTIAGPPKYITLRRNIDRITAQAATYGKEVAAIVSDINNNPVPDGTVVTFRALVTGYQYYGKLGRFERQPLSGEWTPIIDTVAFRVSSEHLDTTRPYRPLRFNDVNGNGIPDRGDWIEPCYPDTDCGPGQFIDLDNDGRRTTAEWIDTTDAAFLLFASQGGNVNHIYSMFQIVNGSPVYTYDPSIPAHLQTFFDIDRNRNGLPNPRTNVLIERTVQTVDGIADNILRYGQSDANRIVVRLWAECQGIVSDPHEFVPPMLEGARNWDPFE
jgi:hypothetical protein